MGRGGSNMTGRGEQMGATYWGGGGECRESFEIF